MALVAGGGAGAAGAEGGEEKGGTDVCGGAGGPGRAVQVDSMKPTLKAPGCKRSKLRYEELLSTFAFKFNLRRYNLGGFTADDEASVVKIQAAAKVVRCRLTLSNPS